jgi:hypothetical protein
MSLKQMQALDTASEVKQEPVRIMGFDCVCGRRMEVSAEQGVVPAPQRTWAGLTSYEIQEIHLKESHWGNFACAIEAKLKEKNT